ncbi:hypothetical protein G3N57_04575 [Paraburkholderia sp. Se-20369]|nr:hypothetical protein [Paraburkholderia sp. Se-20369]TCW75992.1 hypothetical protein C5O80_37280 [Burkholderia sp. SRS-46]
MLSPHQFAALLLIDGTAAPVGFDSGDLAARVERQVTALEQLASEHRRARRNATGRCAPETIDRRRH